MTYFSPIATQFAQPVELPTASQNEQTDFTPLEWSIVRLARNDKLWTIRQSSPVQKFLNFILGRRANRLANDRLEALRQMAVQSWHNGLAVASDKVAAFLEAGFTASQYRLLVTSVLRSTEPSGIGGYLLI